MLKIKATASDDHIPPQAGRHGSFCGAFAAILLS